MLIWSQSGHRTWTHIKKKYVGELNQMLKSSVITVFLLIPCGFYRWGNLGHGNFSFWCHEHDVEMQSYYDTFQAGW